MAATIIGASIVIDGELSSTDDVVVHGRMRGRIETSGHVRAERGGVIEADVRGGEIVVAGRLAGDVIAAGRVEIQSDAEVSGNVRASRILIADGARFRGSVDMETAKRHERD